MQYYNKSNGVTIEVSEAVFVREYKDRGFEIVVETSDENVKPKKGKTDESVR